MTTSILGYKQAPGSKTWQTIPELTIDQVDKATNPRENGQNDGSRNYPKVDSPQCAETETRIVYEVENYLKNVDDMTNKEFTDITRQAEPMALDNVEDDFGDLRLEAQKNFDRYYSLTTRPELKKLRVAERRELRNLKLFKEQNKLERLAKYPTSHIFYIAILGLCLVGESCGNMIYFSSGNDLGLLGGYLQAFGVSAINIAVSFAFGFLALRNMHHVRKLRAFAGAGFFGLWMAIISVSHLLVAHYRDLLLIDPDNAMLRTWDKFREGPFEFQAMDSTFVLIFGLVVAVVALLEGYNFDDVYPRYGSVDRDYRKKEEALEKAEAAVRETMLLSINDAERKINERLKGYEDRVENLTDLYTGATSVVEHFDNIYQQVDDIIHSVVTTYREANMRIRTDAVPASFSKMPVVERLLRKEQFGSKLALLKGLKETSMGKLTTMRRNASEILKSFAEETGAMGDKLDALTDEVARKAKEQIKQDEEEI